MALVAIASSFAAPGAEWWTLQIPVVNPTNGVALYNFLSTFRGTHFVASRS